MIFTSNSFLLGLIHRSNLLTFYKYPTISNFRSATTNSRQELLMSKGLPKKRGIIGVQNVVLIVSGKGGVGKSTTAVNVATALAQKNLSVGLLDADVFGPSVPHMMNLNGVPNLDASNKMLPLLNYDVKCMSMGFLLTEKNSVLWRGLMVMNALEQLLRNVNWGVLDVLVVDTPPGTGDTLLSLIQNVPISGVLIVCTPQKSAIEIIRRGATMIQKLNIPIIGLVSNMNTIRCPHCENIVDIFGNVVDSLATDLNVNVLADIPLDSRISDASDCGLPIVIASPESEQGQKFKEIAAKVIEHLQHDTAQIHN